MYAGIKEYKLAWAVIQPIKPYSGQEAVDKAGKNFLDILFATSQVLKAILSAQESPSECLKIVSGINFKVIPKNMLKISIFLEFCEVGIAISSIKDLATNFIDDLVAFVKITPQSLRKLIGIASKLGVKMEQEGMSVESIDLYLLQNKPLTKILNIQAKAEFFLSKKDYGKAVELATTALELIKHEKFEDDYPESHINIILGDACFNKGDKDKARTAYKNAVAKKPLSEDESFNNAWANYRMGLLESDPKEALKYFEISSEIFKATGHNDYYAKSLGEIAVTWAQQSRYFEFAQIVEKICRGFYIDKQDFYGVACAVCMGQLVSLSAELKKEPIKNEEKGIIFPALSRGIHDKALSILQPKAGIFAAFYAVSEFYKLIGCEEDARRVLQLVFDREVISNAFFDANAFLLTTASLTKYLLTKGSREELKNYWIKVQRYDSQVLQAEDCNAKTRPQLAKYIFSSFEECISNVEMSRRDLILGSMEDAINILLREQDRIWWVAELARWRFVLAKRDRASKAGVKDYCLEAYKYGNQGSNFEGVTDAGWYLAFELFTFFTEDEVYQIHSRLAEIFAMQNASVESVYQPFGSNLYAVWKNFPKRIVIKNEKLSQLITTVTLLEEAGFAREGAALIMVIVLFKNEDIKVDISNIIEELKKKNLIERVPKSTREKYGF